MKTGLKYILILIFLSALGSSLLIFLGNTQPNVEVVVLNKSGKSLASIHLQTEKSKRKVVLRGIEVGTEAVVKFHNDGADIFSLLVRFSEGKEVKGANVYFKPGDRVVATVTKEEITTQHDKAVNPAQ